VLAGTNQCSFFNMSSPDSNGSPRLVEALLSNIFDSEGRILYRVKLVNQETHDFLTEEAILATSCFYEQTMLRTPADLLFEFHHGDVYIQFEEYHSLLSAARESLAAAKAGLVEAEQDLAALTGWTPLPGVIPAPSSEPERQDSESILASNTGPANEPEQPVPGRPDASDQRKKLAVCANDPRYVIVCPICGYMYMTIGPANLHMKKRHSLKDDDPRLFSKKAEDVLVNKTGSANEPEQMPAIEKPTPLPGVIPAPSSEPERQVSELIFASKTGSANEPEQPVPGRLDAADQFAAVRQQMLRRNKSYQQTLGLQSWDDAAPGLVEELPEEYVDIQEELLSGLHDVTCFASRDPVTELPKLWFGIVKCALNKNRVRVQWLAHDSGTKYVASPNVEETSEEFACGEFKQLMFDKGVLKSPFPTTGLKEANVMLHSIANSAEAMSRNTSTTEATGLIKHDVFCVAGQDDKSGQPKPWFGIQVQQKPGSNGKIQMQWLVDNRQRLFLSTQSEWVAPSTVVTRFPDVVLRNFRDAKGTIKCVMDVPFTPNQLSVAQTAVDAYQAEIAAQSRAEDGQPKSGAIKASKKRSRQESVGSSISRTRKRQATTAAELTFRQGIEFGKLERNWCNTHMGANIPNSKYFDLQYQAKIIAEGVEGVIENRSGANDVDIPTRFVRANALARTSKHDAKDSK
jgi:hypothetical protein